MNSKPNKLSSEDKIILAFGAIIGIVYVVIKGYEMLCILRIIE